MKVDYIYTIIEETTNADSEIILATTSKRQAKVVLHELKEAIDENTNLKVKEYTVGSYLNIEEYDEDYESWNWYVTYRVEKHPIVKYGYTSSLIEDKKKVLSSK